MAVLVGCALAACSDGPSPGPEQPGGGANTAGATPPSGNMDGGRGGGTPGGDAGTTSAGVGTTGGGAGNGGAGPAAVAGATQSGVAGRGGTGGDTMGGGAGAGGSNAGGMAGNGGNPFPEGIVKPRIMIIGDSITAGPGCYKKFLLKDLKDNGHSSFEFVGEYPDDCGGGVMHSAVSCSTAVQYTQATFTVPGCTNKTHQGLAPLAAKHKPDLLLIQLGVNDAWGNRSPTTILGSYAKLVEQARAQNPRIVLVIAQIQKIKPDCSNQAVYDLTEALVKAVPAWAAEQDQANSPVFVADLWTNSDFSKAETTDCVHPNDAGAQRMGHNWYDALKGILKK
jgi:lysophospholipase L1-like esterase